MGGIFYQNVENDIIQSLRKDNPKKLQDIIIKQNLDPQKIYTNRKRTLVQLCCYFLSPKCLSTLIKLNYDYNKKEISNNYTPLYIVCKFNSLEMVKILLSKEDCAILQKTDDNFNEFDIAFLKGNYEICYYLLYEYKNESNNINNEKKNKKIIKDEEKENNNINNLNKKQADEEITIVTKKKSKAKKDIIDPNTDQPYQRYFLSAEFDLDTFISLQNNNKAPLFNMELFYQSLLNRIPPKKCPSFAAERKRTKEMLTKIPDPNETWGHFFKRLVNFELYNPPMVDKRNVSQMNSMYMNAQMKLMESEYGIKLSYYNENENRGAELDDSKEENDDEKYIFKVNKKRNDSNDFEGDNSPKENTNDNILKLNIKKSTEKNKKDEEDKDDNNEETNNVRVKDDFYSVEINNTSERKIKMDDNN